MTTIHDLQALGQSIWYDNISRGMLESGHIQALINQGVRGMTSNPSIFEKAIKGGCKAIKIRLTENSMEILADIPKRR